MVRQYGACPRVFHSLAREREHVCVLCACCVCVFVCVCVRERECVWCVCAHTHYYIGARGNALSHALTHYYDIFVIIYYYY